MHVIRNMCIVKRRKLIYSCYAAWIQFVNYCNALLLKNIAMLLSLNMVQSEWCLKLYTAETYSLQSRLFALKLLSCFSFLHFTKL